MTLASPCRPRSGSPPSWTTSSSTCCGGLMPPKPAKMRLVPNSPIQRLLAGTRVINAILPAAYFVQDLATGGLAEPAGAADLG